LTQGDREIPDASKQRGARAAAILENALRRDGKLGGYQIAINVLESPKWSAFA